MAIEMGLDGTIQHCDLSPVHCVNVKRPFSECTLKRIPRIVDSAEKLLHLHDPEDSDQPLWVNLLQRPLDYDPSFLSDFIIDYCFEYRKTLQYFTDLFRWSEEALRIAKRTWMPQQL